MTKRKSLCIHGHDISDDNNVYIYGNERVCKACNARRNAKQELKPKVKERRRAFYEKTQNSIWRRYSNFKTAAKFYKKDFTITQEYYTVLVEPNECHYCKGPLPRAGYGIDRQNNKIGYVVGNVVPCCERCNEKKGSLEGIGFKYPRTVELLLEMLNQ